MNGASILKMPLPHVQTFAEQVASKFKDCGKDEKAINRVFDELHATKRSQAESYVIRDAYVAALKAGAVGAVN